jgi:hypothetical protein
MIREFWTAPSGDSQMTASFRDHVCFRESSFGRTERHGHIGGYAACIRAGILILTDAIERGIAINWADMEKGWYYTFIRELVPTSPRRREKRVRLLCETVNGWNGLTLAVWQALPSTLARHHPHCPDFRGLFAASRDRALEQARLRFQPSATASRGRPRRSTATPATP